MATQEQWYNRLKSWLPSWWHEEEVTQTAVLQGFAKVLEAIDVSIEQHQAQTFIDQAESSYLDEHGFERTVIRESGELDSAYAPRIKELLNTVTCPQLKALVDALLEVGECTIIEDWQGVNFLNRDIYLNRGVILIIAIYNVFSIIVDKQVHEPYSFYNRENFLTREDFIGLQDSRIELFERIVAAVNKAKALGTMYRVIERVG